MATEKTVGSEELWIEKDKDSKRTMRFRLDDFMPAGDTLAEAVWTVTPAGPGAPSIVSHLVTGASASVRIEGGTPLQWYGLRCAWRSTSGEEDDFVVRVFITEDVEAGLLLGSALFPNKFAAIAKMRTDRLMMMARSALPGIEVSDSYLWDKVLAAEASIAHQLRVPLRPTRFFPLDPTPAQLAELGGMPWELDPAYDYEPDMFTGGRAGYIVLRNKPVNRINSLRLMYPAQDNVVLDMPPEWWRLDKKYGHLNIVPSSSVSMAGFSGSLIGNVMGASRLPFSLHIDYVAGLENVGRDFPDLLNLVLKSAALSILEDAFLPQSGSISADGLSQSISSDASKYHESIDQALNGVNGNGGLMAKIHGIRMAVL